MKCNINLERKMFGKLWIFIRNMSLENWIMAFGIISGMLFLIAAIAGAWRYFFSAFICFSSAVMVSEDKPKPKKMNR